LDYSFHPKGGFLRKPAILINITTLIIIFQKPETARITTEIQQNNSRNTNSYQTGLIIPESVKKYWETHTPDYRYPVVEIQIEALAQAQSLRPVLNEFLKWIEEYNNDLKQALGSRKKEVLKN